MLTASWRTATHRQPASSRPVPLAPGVSGRPAAGSRPVRSSKILRDLRPLGVAELPVAVGDAQRAEPHHPPPRRRTGQGLAQPQRCLQLPDQRPKSSRAGRLKLTRLGGHCVAAEVVIMSRVEQLVERDHLLAVGVVPAGAQAGAEGVAVGAALLTEVEAVAVGALVDDLVADDGAGLS